jgi:tripartite ATP-independent transporter DctM subunit
MTLVPIVLLFLGFPIFVVLLATAAIAIVIFYSIPLTVLHQVMFGSLDSAALLAVPFFIFAGEIMAAGGISGRLVAWAKSLFGRSKASLPITTVATCVVFGAISGSSAATVAAVGRITFRPMLDAGYDRRFATGLLTASGLIDNMIPPSIAMILYAIVAEQSLVRIFTAGFVPGLLFAFAFVAYVLVKSRGSAIDPPEPFRWARLGRETLNAAWALGMPVIILGGIYTGVLSANEAGGAACVYAILVAMFVHRDVGVTQLLDLARRSAYVTSQLMVIVASAGVFSWLLTTVAPPRVSPTSRRARSVGRDAALHRQRISAARRHLLRSGARDPAAHADPPSGGQGGRHRSHPLRHRHDRESEYRMLHPAVRHQYFRGASGVQATGLGHLSRRHAVHLAQHRRACGDHLRAGAVAVPDSPARLNVRARSCRSPGEDVPFDARRFRPRGSDGREGARHAAQEQ